jgi:hypothetical protein
VSGDLCHSLLGQSKTQEWSCCLTHCWMRVRWKAGQRVVLCVIHCCRRLEGRTGRGWSCSMVATTRRVTNEYD